MRNRIRQPNGIAGCLVSHSRQRNPLRLRLNHSRRLAVHKQQIIRNPRLQREFPHRHPAPGVQVQFLAILDHPTAGGELRIDILTGLSLRCSHDVPTKEV